ASNSNLTFLDPCNQQIITLFNDSDQYYVLWVANQTTTPPFCIGAQDDPNSLTDLVLYEFQNGSSIFSPSSRFKGVLSGDYLESYTLRITTNPNLYWMIPYIDISGDFGPLNSENQKFYVNYTTNQKTTCTINLNEQPPATLDFTVLMDSDNDAWV